MPKLYRTSLQHGLWKSLKAYLTFVVATNLTSCDWLKNCLVATTKVERLTTLGIKAAILSLMEINEEFIFP